MSKLLGSLKRDSLPVDQSPNDWRDARNMVLNRKVGALSVEDGFSNVTPTVGGAGTANFPSGSTKNVVGFKSIDGVTVYLFATSDAFGGEIGIVGEDGKYYPKIKDSASKIVLNLDRQFPTQVVAEKKFNDNIVIIFKDSDGVPKILNLDCIPFRIASDFTVETADLSKAQALIRLFPLYKKPIPTAFDLLEGQGALPVGGYFPIFAYEGYDGSVTPWSEVYNGFPIYSISAYNQSTAISGGQKDEISSKAAKISLSNIDTNYRKLKVGYLYISGGITRAYEESSFPISSTSSTLDVLFTGNNKTEIDIEEVLTPPIVYDKVETFANLQKTLYLGNVETPEDYNFQTYANEIVINWVRDVEVKINGTVRDGDSTFQDPKKVFFHKSFKGGECYAYYIVINWTNGTKSKAFHIPGRASSGTDKDVLAGAEYDALDGSNDIYRYQVENTHGQTTQTKGAMGFWENENEEYPVDPDNPTTAVHPDFANIPGISYANRKVRHHVFPDLTYLDNGANTEKFITGTFGAYPANDVEGKIFGIEVSNVEIPAEIQPFVASWEIHYAERTNSNIRVIASDVPSKLDSAVGGKDYFRFQPFDLMHSRASLMPTYIKPLMEFTSLSTAAQYDNFVENLDTIIPFPDLAYGYKLVAVEEALYLGQDTTTPYNNAGYSDNFLIKTTDKTTPNYAVPSGASASILMYDLCIYKRDMYLGFQNQSLVSTGYVFAVTASGVQTTQNVYGGDVYLNRHSAMPTSTGTQYISYVCESASNIGLRNEDIAQSKYFAPKSATPSPSWFGYRTDYNCLNRFNQSITVYYPSEVCLAEDVTIHRNRIPYSASESTENSTINWRIFKINSYYDSVNDKGEIWCLTGQDRTLYIHHKYSLFIAEAKDTLNTAGEEIALKVAGIFDRPAREVIPSEQGVGGTQSKFSCIVCRLGYCFVDKKAKKVYIFNREGLKEISKQGLEQFFVDNSLSMNDILLGGDDNPFIGEGYCMGYDELNNRLLLTKRAMNFGSGAYEFTLSYSPDANNGQGGWISFHDYYPAAYVAIRDTLYTIRNHFSDLAGTQLFKHSLPTTKAKYYDGVIKESYVDVISNEIPTESKEFESIEWITNVEKDRVNYPNDTFTHLMTYNETQCSGKLAIRSSPVAKYYSKDARNVIGSWFYNDFRDLISNPASAFLDEYNALITGNISSNKPWYKRSKFISKYLIFRLITDNIIQKDLHFSSFSVKFKKCPR